MLDENKLKGDIGVINTILILLESKLNVLQPIGDRLPYDLVVEKNAEFKRIQVKYRASKNGVIRLKQKSSSSKTIYDKNSVDAFAVFDPFTKIIAFINIEEINYKNDFIVRFNNDYYCDSDTIFAQKYVNPLRLFDSSIVNDFVPEFKKRFLKGKRKVERPDKQDLEKMIWEIPTTQIAKKFGVTDNAIAKWCNSYDIKKPGRGYWRKLETKKFKQ